MDYLEEIKKLEKEKIFIHYDYDYYKDGVNCNFSIQFKYIEKDNNQTGWYGDNHEFGDIADVMKKSVDVANFMKSLDLELYFRNLTDKTDYFKQQELRKEVDNFVFNKNNL